MSTFESVDRQGLVIRPMPELHNAEDQIVPGFYQFCPPPRRPITFLNLMVLPVGRIGGGHFHRGEDASKQPETIFLVSGRIELTVIFPDSQQAVYDLSTVGGSIVEIIIPPYVWHQTKCLEPAVLIEPRCTPFRPEHSDTVRCDPDQFRLYIHLKVAEMLERHSMAV